jgi:hypothetical protein
MCVILRKLRLAKASLVASLMGRSLKGLSVKKIPPVDTFLAP